MLLLLDAQDEIGGGSFGGAGSLFSREWLLAQLPLRKVELAIGRALKKSGHTPVLAGLLQKGVVAWEDVGVVDIDVELGNIHVHSMERGRYYLEAVYTGVIDVDVRLRYDRGDGYVGDKSKSFILDIEVLTEVDVRDGEVASFDVLNVEVI